MPKGDLAGEISVKARQKAKLHQKLEAVAYAQDESAVTVELFQPVVEACACAVAHVAPAHARCLGSAEIVPVQKSAREDEKVVLVQDDAPLCNVREEDDVRLVCSGLTGRVGRFLLGVGAVALDNEGVDSAHMRSSLAEMGP